MANHAHSITAASTQATVLDTVDLISLASGRRPAIERAIELMIAPLDAVDGDPDVEQACEDEGADADLEPSLSRAETGYGASQHFGGSSAADDDREADHSEVSQ